MVCPMTIPEVPRTWAEERRLFPSTTSESTGGTACCPSGCWACRSAGPARSRAARNAWRSGRAIMRPGGGRPPPARGGRGRRSPSGLRARQGTEDQAVALRGDIDLDFLTTTELAGQDPLGERVLDVALDGPLEGAGAVLGIEPVVGQEGDGALRQAHLVPQAALHFAEQDRDDLRDVGLVQRVEDDHVVQAVQELRVEDLLDLVLDGAGHVLVRRLRRLLMEAE